MGLAVAAPALGETLKVATPQQESIRLALTITVSGVADGSHSLYVYADEDRSSCAPNPSEEKAEGPRLVVLSKPEGDPLQSGSFSKSYTYTYPRELPVFCAYLDDAPSDTPDAMATEQEMKYGENAEEAQPTGSGTFTIPGAIEAAPVNPQLQREFWERITREEVERTARAQEAQSKGQPQPAQCVAPLLKGRSLVSAKRSLHRAKCRLGKVTVPARARGGAFVVIRQGQPRGTQLPAGAAVGITLAARRR
jgi:hypothetical protein